MKKLFASETTVVSNDGKVDRWSVTNSATRREHDRLCDRRLDGGEIGHEGLLQAAS